MIRHEIDFTWRMALSVTAGLTWRLWVLGICIYFAFKLTGPIGTDWSFLLLVLAQFFISFAMLFTAVFWLFGSSRLGSLRIMFMEQANYQSLLANQATNADVQP